MALSANRATAQVGGVSGPVVERFPIPVAAAVRIFEGALVQVEGGYAYPAGASGTKASSLSVGRANAEADNTSGSAGAISVEVAEGCFEWNNGTSGDALTAANFGAVVYAIDDQTVGLTQGAQAWQPAVHTGTGPAVGMTVSGTPLAVGVNEAITVESVMVLGGAVATATFQYRVDGGQWSTTTTTAATVAISNGLTLNFAAGTYVLGDTYTQTYSGTRAPAGRFLGLDPVTSMAKVQTVTV